VDLLKGGEREKDSPVQKPPLILSLTPAVPTIATVEDGLASSTQWAR